MRDRGAAVKDDAGSDGGGEEGCGWKGSTGRGGASGCSRRGGGSGRGRRGGHRWEVVKESMARERAGPDEDDVVVGEPAERGSHAEEGDGVASIVDRGDEEDVEQGEQVQREGDEEEVVKTDREIRSAGQGGEGGGERENTREERVEEKTRDDTRSGGVDAKVRRNSQSCRRGSGRWRGSRRRGGSAVRGEDSARSSAR